LFSINNINTRELVLVSQDVSERKKEGKKEMKPIEVIVQKWGDLCYDSLFWQLTWLVFNRITGVEF